MSRYQTGSEEFFLKNINVEQIFNIIDRTDYFFLYHIRECAKSPELETGVYLSDLAEQMKMPVPEISKAVKKLEDKGYVSWKLDERKEKTYIVFTNKAIELMQSQKARMTDAYEKVISTIPEQELKITLSTLGKIRDILNENFDMK